MNKISLIIFLLLCVLFLVNGLYQGVAHDNWTALIIAILAISLGSFSMIRKKNK